MSALLAAPAATGLFHRAAVQSGSLLRHQPRELAAMAARSFIGKLGLARDNIAAIGELPWQQLLAAQTAVGAQLFAPVVDGSFLPHDPFDPLAPDESADIPLIVSTTHDDAGIFFDNFDLDADGLKQILVARYGDHATGMLALYREKWPDKSPFLLQARIITDAGFRRFAHAQSERKAAQARAPVYMYEWDWPAAAFEGRFGAVHAIDVPASFGNVREPIVGAGSPAGRTICAQLSASWLAFAKTGDPNTALVPHWPAFSDQERATMVFDEPLRVVTDPDGEIRRFWSAMPVALSVLG